MFTILQSDTDNGESIGDLDSPTLERSKVVEHNDQKFLFTIEGYVVQHNHATVHPSILPT